MAFVNVTPLMIVVYVLKHNGLSVGVGLYCEVYL